MFKTQINPNINKTMINQEIGHFTQINPHLDFNTTITEGTYLLNKYKVVKTLNISAGEANLYLCEFEENMFVAKVYRRKQAIKPEVLRSLKEIESPFIAKLYDYGLYNEMPFEILPYYKNGSLQNKKFTVEELKK